MKPVIILVTLALCVFPTAAQESQTLPNAEMPDSFPPESRSPSAGFPKRTESVLFRHTIAIRKP